MAQYFHSHCDHKGPTLTIIRSHHNYLFGGYSPIPWDSTNTDKKHAFGYSPIRTDTDKKHADSFIFTLTNPNNIPPTKYAYDTQKPHTRTIGCYEEYGPLFGGDITVFSESDVHNHSFTNFPFAYEDTTGFGRATFNGTLHFHAHEIDVYLVTEM
jgi:BTB/POZ domain-containing protein KCTD9